MTWSSCVAFKVDVGCEWASFPVDGIQDCCLSTLQEARACMFARVDVVGQWEGHMRRNVDWSTGQFRFFFLFFVLRQPLCRALRPCRMRHLKSYFNTQLETL